MNPVSAPRPEPLRPSPLKSIFRADRYIAFLLVAISLSQISCNSINGFEGLPGNLRTTIEGAKIFHYESANYNRSNPYYKPPQEFSWKGSIDDLGFATGAGILTVIRVGGQISATSCTMINGKMEGVAYAAYSDTRHPERISNRRKLVFSQGKLISSTPHQTASEIALEKSTTDKANADKKALYQREKDALYRFRREVREGTYLQAFPTGAGMSVSLAMFGGGAYYGRVIATVDERSLRIRRDNYRSGDSVPEVFTTHRGRTFPPDWSPSKMRNHIAD